MSQHPPSIYEVFSTLALLAPAYMAMEIAFAENGSIDKVILLRDHHVTSGVYTNISMHLFALQVEIRSFLT